MQVITRLFINILYITTLRDTTTYTVYLFKGKAKIGGSKTNIFGEENDDRKRTEEGFKVYKEEELKMNVKNAGYTDKCPFDCDCCF